MDSTTKKYHDAHWFWDDNKLNIIGPNADVKSIGSSTVIGNRHSKGKSITNVTSGVNHAKLIINFNDQVDALEQVRFRRRFRRRIGREEKSVVTVQDIRDVVLFSIPPTQLTLDNITYFHMPSMDLLLRALIIYFQYFIQIWETLGERHEQSEHKLFHPNVIKTDRFLRCELGDLRAMVSSAYLAFLIGVDDTKPYHHIKSSKSNISLGEKDVRFIEFLYQVCTKFVWIAMRRRNQKIIEVETNRMFRSNSYNTVERQASTQKITSFLDAERKVFYGSMDPNQKKLLQRSFIAQEIFKDHDYRMLSLLHNYDIIDGDDRLHYLQVAYCAPEERLLELGVSLGILGYPHSDFDAVLSLQFTRNDDGTVKQWPKMVLPQSGSMKYGKKQLISKEEIIEFKKRSSMCAKKQCAKWLAFCIRANTRERK